MNLQLVEGILPFYGKNDLELQSKILKKPFPKMKNQYSERFNNTLERMLIKVSYKHITYFILYSLYLYLFVCLLIYLFCFIG
jgi:hypothetical protein